MASYPELSVRPAPHIHSGESVNETSLDITIALLPLILTSIYIFGFPGFIIIAVCTGGAVLGEIVARSYYKKESNLADGTAIVTGLLLAMTLPPTAWWAMVPLYGLGGFLATAVFREAMGGLGRNRFNPALMSRLFLLIGRTAMVYMAPFVLNWLPAAEPYLYEMQVVDAYSKATPLMTMAEGIGELPAFTNYLFAYEGGALGETSLIAILIGLVYLLYKRRIEWEIPAVIAAGVFLLGIVDGAPIYHVISGGMLFGAIFMATDWVTRPVTFKGRIIYALGIAALIMFFRLAVSEVWIPVGGVAFAILIMNGFVPILEKITKKQKYGAVNKEAKS